MATWKWDLIANIRGTQGIPGPAGPAWPKGRLAASTNWQTLTDGAYPIWTFADASSMTPALPELGGGELEVYTIGSAKHVRWSVTGGAINGIYRNSYNGATWAGWKRMDRDPMDAWIMTRLPTGQDANTLDVAGYFGVWTSADAATMTNLPPGMTSGLIKVERMGNQVFREAKDFAGLSKWEQYSVAGGTQGAWRRTDAGAISIPKENGPGSGFKVLPLCVTLPSTGTKTVVTARRDRHMMVWYAPIFRWKIHVRNYDYRLNQSLPGTVSFNGVAFGEHDTTGAPTYAFKTAPSVLATAFTAVDGAEWVSGWINQPLEAGKEYLLSLGYTAAAGQEFFVQVGTVGADTNAASFDAIAAPVGTGAALLDVWIEAETYATTPSFAVLDDSTGSGVGAALTVRDSWPSKLAKRLKALPVHYTASGDSYNAYSNTTWGKWTRWQGLDKPDCLIAGLGNNDLFQGADLATMKTRVGAVIPALKAITSMTLYWATVFPRTSVTGAQETERRAFNAWLRTLPHGARDCFELAAAISSDDETINPAFDADTVHLNAAGYDAVQLAVNRPITSPPVMYAAL